MDDSILDTIKRMLGVDPSYEAFDPVLIADINTALVFLRQIGIGKEGFVLLDKYNTWDEFYNDDNLSHLKSYVYLKTRMLFDPPTGSVATASESMLKELEWRLLVTHDYEGQS